MIDKFVEWQEKKYSGPEKVLFALSLSSVFIFIFIPGLPFLLYKKLDNILSLPNLITFPLNVYLGFLISLLGLFLFAWTIWLFLKVGRGTQTPIIPTQKLVIVGPYAFTRNPMVLGVIIWIVGLGIFVNSFSFIAVGLIIPLLYLLYIRLVEEKELEARFGQQYSEYKKKVPFIIPSLRSIKL